MKYQRVWLSTVEHISEFSKLIGNNKTSKESSYESDLPQGFPYIKTIAKKSPVALLAKGEFEILGSGIIFKSRKYRIENLQIYNLKENVEIELNFTDIAISRFKNPNPFKKSAVIEWIKIHCDNEIDGFHKHILICRVPFYSSFHNIRNSTNSLYESLIEKVGNP